MVNVARIAVVCAVLAVVSACVPLDESGTLVPPTVVEDASLPSETIEVAGHTRRVHLERYGDEDAPAMLLLHGSLSDLRAFRPFASFADQGYQVVMWDQRGNGLSERITAEEYTRESIIEEIDAIKQLVSPDQPVTMIGHSFGAMYTALYMSEKPENVSKAVLIEPGGLNSTIFTETFDEIINVNLFARGSNQSFWQSEFLTPSDHEEMDYRALMMLLDGKQTNYYCDASNPPTWPVWRPGAMVERLRYDILGRSGTTYDFDFAAGLDQFPRKVLILAGECSALGPDYQVEHHLPLFADATVIGLDGVGHRLMAEKPEDTLLAIQGYLEE
jgi:proline iminopeptidase